MCCVARWPSHYLERCPINYEIDGSQSNKCLDIKLTAFKDVTPYNLLDRCDRLIYQILGS
jgi:hypothetical protein